VIPWILYLRVGTGSNYTTGVLAANAVKNLIRFAPTAAQVGNGDNVTLNATSGGAMLDAVGASRPRMVCVRTGAQKSVRASRRSRISRGPERICDLVQHRGKT